MHHVDLLVLLGSQRNAVEMIMRQDLCAFLRDYLLIDILGPSKCGQYALLFPESMNAESIPDKQYIHGAARLILIDPPMKSRSRTWKRLSDISCPCPAKKE